MKEPVDHVARSILPWRPEEATLTECGLVAASYPTITREAYFARLKDLGQTRTAMLTCVTCAETIRRWKPWQDDPVDAMKRETEKYWGGRQGLQAEKWEAFRRELLAIAALIAQHREEFDAHVTALGDVVELDEARKARQSRPRRPRTEGRFS